MLRRYRQTSHSPSEAMTPLQLSRYLDYCTEMLSLIGKIAALYVQRFDDSSAVAAVSEVEQLTTGLRERFGKKSCCSIRSRTQSRGLIPTREAARCLCQRWEFRPAERHRNCLPTSRRGHRRTRNPPDWLNFSGWIGSFSSRKVGIRNLSSQNSLTGRKFVLELIGRSGGLYLPKESATLNRPTAILLNDLPRRTLARLVGIHFMNPGRLTKGLK